MNLDLFLDSHKIVGVGDRVELLAVLLREFLVTEFAEVGVFAGELSAQLLSRVENIQRYVMIDPWRNLPNWDKPSNLSNENFEIHYKKTLEVTAAWRNKLTILRGTTLEVVSQIPDNSLDALYIDADHTLRGITLDLHLLWPKLRNGGYLFGDDFTKNIWQHSKDFSPSLVFPYAVYFAELMRVPIYSLPHNQFMIHKNTSAEFQFKDSLGYSQRNIELVWIPEIYHLEN